MTATNKIAKRLQINNKSFEILEPKEKALNHKKRTNKNKQ